MKDLMNIMNVHRYKIYIVLHIFIYFQMLLTFIICGTCVHILSMCIFMPELRYGAQSALTSRRW